MGARSVPPRIRGRSSHLGRETSRGDETTYMCVTADRQRCGHMPFRLPALGAKRLYAARSSWWPRRDTLSRTTRRDDNTRDNPGGVTTMCLSEPRLTQAAGRWKWRHVARKQRKHDGRSTGCIAQSPTGDDFGRTSQKGRPTGPRLRSGRLPDERLVRLLYAKLS